MEAIIDTLRLEIHLTFWRMAAWCTAFAMQHRQATRLAIRFGPVVLCGIFAFMLGRLLGAAVLTLIG